MKLELDNNHTFFIGNLNMIFEASSLNINFGQTNDMNGIKYEPSSEHLFKLKVTTYHFMYCD